MNTASLPEVVHSVGQSRDVRRWPRMVGVAASTAMLASGIALLVPGTANAVTIVQDVNVYGYCRSIGFTDTRVADPRSPYSWYCVRPGARSRYLTSTDMTRACQRVLGPYAYAILWQSNAWGWRCIRF